MIIKLVLKFKKRKEKCTLGCENKGRVTMTTESSKNTCAQPLTNTTLNLILTLILTLLY